MKQNKEELIYFNGKQLTKEEYLHMLEKYSLCHTCPKRQRCDEE